jgi:hypothetical protein
VIINEDDLCENWADPCAPSGGRSHPCDRNHNDNVEGEEDTLGGKKGTGKGKGTKHKKGNGNGKWMAIGNGKGIDTQTPGGDDISSAIAWQLQKKWYEPDSNTEG